MGATEDYKLCGSLFLLYGSARRLLCVISYSVLSFFSFNWNGKFFKTVIIVNSERIFNDQQKDNNSP